MMERYVVAALRGLLFAVTLGCALLLMRAACDEPVSAAGDLPEDPALRCATKALRGDYGQLAEWQRVGYRQFVKHGSTRRLAWTTTYHSNEGFKRGDVCRWWGAGCSERVAAANLLLARSWVWTGATGIRQVLDTGARSNDAVARRKGASLWVDFWEERRGQTFGDDNAGVLAVYTAPARGGE